jgi:hypothetical protein
LTHSAIEAGDVNASPYEESAMNPNPVRHARPAVLLVSMSALLGALLVGAMWSARSEARDRKGEPGRRATSFGFDTGPARFGYAIVTPGASTFANHDGRDWRDLEELLEDYGDDVLWLSVEGRDYVVRDRATIDRARDIVEPMQALGERQGRLGAEQGRLGAKQAAIGARQAAIGARQAALSTHLARLALEDDDERARLDIENKLEDLSHRMEELAREHEPLAEKQEELGRRQDELGRQMEQLSKRVTAAMERLAEEAIASGNAERLGRR